MTAEELLVARSVRPDLVDGKGVLRYSPGSDTDVEVNVQYPSPTGRAAVLGGGLRVRLQPHIDAQQVGALKLGDEVDTWGCVEDWTLVRYVELQGWAATRYLGKIS